MLVKCPGCRVDLAVTQENQIQVRCPACKILVNLPSSQGTPQSPPPQIQPPLASESDPGMSPIVNSVTANKKKSRFLISALVIGGISALFVLLCVLVFVKSLWNPSETFMSTLGGSGNEELNDAQSTKPILDLSIEEAKRQDRLAFLTNRIKLNQDRANKVPGVTGSFSATDLVRDKVSLFFAEAGLSQDDLGGGFEKICLQEKLPTKYGVAKSELQYCWMEDQTVIGMLIPVDSKKDIKKLAPVYEDLGYSIQVVGAEGYSVSGFNVGVRKFGGAYIDRIQVVFSKVNNDKLDLDDSYTSDWFGDVDSGSAVYSLTSKGQPIVGICWRDSFWGIADMGIVVAK